MNPTANELIGPSMRLLPHQTALVEAFFNPANKPVIVLRGEVGLGKSVALAALASRLLRESPIARVLLLAPGSLRLRYVEMLRGAGTPALSVDRWAFREMLDSASGAELWHGGVVAVLGREFARQADVRNALVTVKWDLLIVDEAHQFRGALTEGVLRQLGEVSKRVVLATLPSLELPDAFPQDTTTVVQWRRDQVVDHDGNLLDAMPRPVLHEVRFSQSPTEQGLAEAIGELCRTYEAGTPQQRWVARSVLRSLRSSPAALEGALIRMRENRNRVVHGIEPLLETCEAIPPDDVPADFRDLGSEDRFAALVTGALSRIEEAGSDSKLATFVALLGHIDAVKTPSTRTCVLTEYLGTLFYLAAEIENLGKKCHVFHGGMNSESRQRILSNYSDGGGILTATGATMSEGVVLTEVTDLVLYDVPGSPVALQQVLGRFDRFGRRTQLNVYALLPSDDAADPDPEAIELLRHFLGSPLPLSRK